MVSRKTTSLAAKDRAFAALPDDPSLAFLNRVMSRLATDPQLMIDLQACLGSDSTDRLLTLLDDLDVPSDSYGELDDDALDALAGGRAGIPLALALLAGTLGTGHGLPALDPAPLVGRAAPAWQAHALPLIQQFEGLALEAYRDPVGIPTIGYGTIRYADGRPVQLGDRISVEQAEQLLREAVNDRYAPALFAAIPAARHYSPQQQAALISFTYNVGVGALQGSTLRRRLLAGDDPQQVIAEELPRWSRGGDRELPGLVRRRAAEVALFRSTPRW